MEPTAILRFGGSKLPPNPASLAAHPARYIHIAQLNNEEMKMLKYELVTPTEENGYCIFKLELENNPLVLFHLTPKRNFDAIISKGFLSASELNNGEVESVSYAKRSSGCFANKGTEITEDLVVFAVEFDTLDKAQIVVNASDIFVYDKDIQPAIQGYCELPEGYKIT